MNNNCVDQQNNESENLILIELCEQTESFGFFGFNKYEFQQMIDLIAYGSKF